MYSHNRVTSTVILLYFTPNVTRCISTAHDPLLTSYAFLRQNARKYCHKYYPNLTLPKAVTNCKSFIDSNTNLHKHRGWHIDFCDDRVFIISPRSTLISRTCSVGTDLLNSDQCAVIFLVPDSLVQSPTVCMRMITEAWFLGIVVYTSWRYTF